MPKKASTNIAFCPHCGNKAPQTLLLSHDCISEEWYLDGRVASDKEPASYFVSECSTCHHLLVYYAQTHIPFPKDFAVADLVWPDSLAVGHGLPESVAECYAEAQRVKRTAPNAFAVLIRRALEALCDDQGTIKGTLHARLGDLVAKGRMPPLLSEMSSVLRLLGNIGAHHSNQRVQPGHVENIDEFFKVIVEYVYVAPAKLKWFRERSGVFDSTVKKHET